MKTFTARNSADALALARGDLGADAVVLRTRSYKRGGLFGVPALGGRPVVEVTAVALSVLQAAAKRREAHAARTRAPAGAAPEIRGPGASARGLREASTPTAGDLIRRTYAAARMDLGEPGAAGAAVAALSEPIGRRPAAAERPIAAERPPSSPTPPAAARPANVEPVADLAGELAAVKALVARVAASQERDAARRAAPSDPTATAADQAPTSEAYATLIRAEVDAELAARLADDGGGADQALAAVAGLLNAPAGGTGGAAGPAGGSGFEAYRRLDGDDRPLTLALVGPTGVGKTTTVAKLAAQLKLRHGRNVGVVTLDTYRIGAVEQLRTYCSIIGTGLHVAATPEALAERLAKLSACDVVLIDTAGRSPRDDDRVGELGGFLAVARPHQTHLVLSLAASAGVLRQAAGRFAEVGLDRVVLTKCDEAVGCGHALATLEAAGLPVSFVTTGQEVPHDIEAFDAEAIARRIVEAPPEPVSV